MNGESIMFIESDIPVSVFESLILKKAVLARIEQEATLREKAKTSREAEEELSQLAWTRTVVPYGLGKSFASVGEVFDDASQNDQNSKIYNVLFNLGVEPADDVQQEMFYVWHDVSANKMQFRRVERDQYLKNLFKFHWEISSRSEAMTDEQSEMEAA